MKEIFVRRQRGLEKTPPTDPRIDSVLAPTHGVMLYEDDVMLVAAAISGEPLCVADRFRKAVQKCRDDQERLALSRDFLERCRKNGVEAKIAADLWVQMAKFNAYSFCRAHAASYARLGYAVAFLKAHHPLEFWTAALNNNQSMYHPRVYVEQAKRMGIRFLLPDINRSGAEFTIEKSGGTGFQPVGTKRAIRVGLSRVAGLGPVSVESILKARAARPFISLSDLLDRAHLGVEDARPLILCGALDSLSIARNALMLELRLWRPMRVAHSGPQPALLSAGPAVTAVVEDYPPERKAADEREILGISVGDHPLRQWREILEGQTDADSRELPRKVGRQVRLAGLLEAARDVESTGGRRIQFLTFDDEFGLFEGMVIEGRCRVQGKRVDGCPALIAGRVQNKYDTITVEADEVGWISE